MKHKSIAAVILLVFMLCLSATTLADNSTTATVPVTLTVDNEYRAINISVPASLPVYVENGTVYVADNATIINNSDMSSVRIEKITVDDGAYKVGNFEDFSGGKTIALKINDCSTTGAGELTINDSAFPVLEPDGTLPITYSAKVSKDARNVENLEAASVVITFAFVD